MEKLARLAALGILALPIAAHAGTSVITQSPFYPPVYAAPAQPTPYWSRPGTLSPTPGTTFYPQNSQNLPQQYGNPALNNFPPGAQTCSAPPYTCPASAPNAPGSPCSCPAEDGSKIDGIVH